MQHQSRAGCQNSVLSNRSGGNPPKSRRIPFPPHPLIRPIECAALRNEEFSRSYEWQKMPASWRPALRITNISLSLSGWNRSAAFTKDCKPQQLPGELFFERSSGFVYFDIEVE